MRLFTLLFLFIASHAFSQDGHVSPGEKIKVLPWHDIISVPASYDTIKELKSFTEVNNVWIAGTDKGVYLIDRDSKKVTAYFKFDIKKHKELFDEEDNILGFNSVFVEVNKAKDKALVHTSNGIVFQISLKENKIDWLIKVVRRLETATYSNKGDLVAIGTRADFKKMSDGKELHYPTLFLINASDGMFIDYFKEYTSVKKILFNAKDTKLLLIFDGNHKDTHLWDMSNKNTHIANYDEKNAVVYDIELLDSVTFITLNGNGISKWNINDPQHEQMIYKIPICGAETILEYKSGKGYLMSHGPHLSTQEPIFFFDEKLKLIDSMSFSMSFDEIQYSNNDSVLILRNGSDVDRSKEGYYFFNIITRKMEDFINYRKINLIIKK